MPIISQKFILFFTTLIICWLALFWDGILAMEAIWRRSDTFAHGYFILPISLWLIYRDREYLIQAKVKPTMWALLPLIGCCFIWLFAFAADINVLLQLSTMTSLVAIIWLAIGHQLTWRYKFPLAYLIFAVPMGENLIPALQDITAWITVLLLKLHGIPVFRDGWYIQIPTGLFEVAVACSGIRYLIASMAVGTLFAYLSYNSFKKQIIFIIFSFLLPIVANGIRAYLIVIIAHYSDMKYATGADHLVYGWIFFGFVIMVMFWVGGKFADPETRSWPSTAIFGKEVNTRTLVSAGFMATAVILSAYFIEKNIRVMESPDQAIVEIENSPQVDRSNWGINFEHPLKSAHVLLETNVEGFYALYGNKQNQGELVTHSNRLYDRDGWTVVDRVTFEFDGQNARYILLRNTSGTERAILYWYKVADKYFVDSTVTKLYQAFSLLMGSADTAHIVAFSVTQYGMENPLEMLKEVATKYRAQLESIEKQ